MKILLPEEEESKFIQAAEELNVHLEGNIIKVFEGTERFKKYLSESLQKDKEKRKQRLELTKVIQDQKEDLERQVGEKEALMAELQEALDEAENAKKEALNDLDLMQRKRQFELINRIVRYALYVIISTGLITTVLYFFAIWYNSEETTLIGSTWSNLLGILLTNSFSIIGTIMGVKYANKSDEDKNV